MTPADATAVPAAPSPAVPVPAAGDQPPADPGLPERSFVDDLRELAEDAQTLFEAEKAFQGARASYALSRGKGVAVRFAMAAALVYFAAIALVVGLLLALAPLITAWGALAAVTLGLALPAFVFFRGATSRLRRMRANLATSEAMP